MQSPKVLIGTESLKNMELLILLFLRKVMLIIDQLILRLIMLWEDDHEW